MLLGFAAGAQEPSDDGVTRSVVEPVAALVIDHAGTDGRRGEQQRVAIPWPRGLLRALPAVRVADDVAPVVVTMRWPDGTVKLAHADVRFDAEPGITILPVVPVSAESDHAGVGVEGLAAAQERSVFGDRLPLVAELEDPFGRLHVAELRLEAPDPALSTDRLLVRPIAVAPLVRDVVETPASGGPTQRVEEVLLACRGYLVETLGARRAVLTLVLDNDPPDAAPERVVGAVRLRSFALRSTDPRLLALPRERETQGLPPPAITLQRTFRQVLLRPGPGHYLADRTAKAFRIDLFLDGDEVDDATRDAARLAVEAPLFVLPELDWTRHTGAFGAHGGPAPVGEVELGRRPGVALAGVLRSGVPFATGVYGAFGDAADAAAQGTPRNGTSALHNLLRWRSRALARLAEAAVLQQLLRPTPGLPARAPRSTGPFRSGLSARVLSRPHGFTVLDYEHFSVDLPFDWYWLTADPIARDELVRATRHLPEILAAVPFRTARGEGWCLQAAVLAAVATGDVGLLRPVLERLRAEVLPRLGGGPDEPKPWTAVLPQPGDVRVLGADEPFDAPWQMAALVLGLHAAWRVDGGDDLRDALLAVAGSIVDRGFVEGVGPKCFVAARDAAVFAYPVGTVPTEGTGWMVVPALAVADEVVGSATGDSRFAKTAEFLVRKNLDAHGAALHGNPWFQVFLDRNPDIR